MSRHGHYKVIARFTDGHEQIARAANYNSAHDMRRDLLRMYGTRAEYSIIDKTGRKIWPRPERTPSP